MSTIQKNRLEALSEAHQHCEECEGRLFAKNEQELSDKVCVQGYEWILEEEADEFKVYRCSGGHHQCMMIKNPPYAMAIGKDGQVTDAPYQDVKDVPTI